MTSYDPHGAVSENESYSDVSEPALGTGRFRNLPEEVRSLYEATEKAIAEDLQSSRWRIDHDHTYPGAVLRHILSSEDVRPAIASYYQDYLLGMSVLSAHCADCGATVAVLTASRNLPHSDHIELANYAYWVTVRRQGQRNRCPHGGQLPDPATLVNEITAAMGKREKYVEKGTVIGFEGRGRIKVRPTRD